MFSLAETDFMLLVAESKELDDPVAKFPFMDLLSCGAPQEHLYVYAKGSFPCVFCCLCTPSVCVCLCVSP